jgi:hypothetical protein
LATAHWGRIVLVAFLFASSAAAIAFTFLPYGTVKEQLDPLSVDRDAGLSRGEFADLILRLRLLALAGVLIGAGLLARGAAIDARVSVVVSSWCGSATAVPDALKRWLAAQRPIYLGAVGLALAAGCVLRVSFLDVPMRYDEATTYNNFASKPLYVSLANYATPNNHLLHTALVKASVAIAGNSPTAVRAPALIAGVLLMPAAFAAACMLYGRSAALVAAAFVATSSTLIEYSANARGYTLAALFTLTTLLAALRIVEGGGPGALAAFAVSGALALYAVPVALYPLGGIVLWTLASLWQRRRLRELGPALGASAAVFAGLTALLYSPVLAASGVRSITSNDFVSPRSWTGFLDALPHHAHETLDSWLRDLPVVVSAVLALGLLASLLLTPRVSRYAFPPLLLILIWTIPVLTLQRAVPYPRIWIPVLPIALAACAGFYGWALSRLGRRVPLVELASACVVVAGSAFVLSNDSVRTSRETGALLDAPAVARYLDSQLESGDAVVATGSDAILEYYLRRLGTDARDALYGNGNAPRAFIVVNVLGGQTLSDLQSDPRTAALGPPRLLKQWPSAQLFEARRASGPRSKSSGATERQ